MAQDARPRVLVVDDEPDSARSIQRLLERRVGASVEVVNCAEAARRKLADGFNLITLDYQLPDCDGLTLLKEIATVYDAPPVVMVTGHGDEQTAVDAFRFGAAGYVVKDQRLAELLTDSVKKALMERRLLETERALRASEEEFETLVETANSVILKLDLDGNITYMNRFGLEFFGYSEEELIGQNVRGHIIADEDLEGRDLESMTRDVLSDPDSHTSNENENIKKNGERVWLAWSNHALYDDEGNTIGNLAVGNDVTERRRATEDYRRLLETVGSIIIRTDKKGNIVFINNYGAEFYGYAEAELVGKNVVGTIVPEIESTGRDLADLIGNIMDDPDSYHRNVNENVKRNGERVWISWSNKAIRDDNGEVIGTLTTGNDITALKAAE